MASIMRRIGYFLRDRRVAVTTVILCSLAIGAAFFRVYLMNDEWRERSSAFVEQVNSLGKTMKPGEVGVIRISGSYADKIVLMPYGCDRIDIERCFLDRPAAFINDLLKKSRDDRTFPALIWLRNGDIISINPAKFTVGVNVILQSWKVRGDREIRVTKELQSPNGFLSVSLLEDEDAGHPSAAPPAARDR